MYEWMQGLLLANGADLLHPSEDDDPEFMDPDDIDSEYASQRKRLEMEEDHDNEDVYTEIVSITDADSGENIDFTVDEPTVNLTDFS
jgi:hypothetical protein